ncbi:hypothetical protein IU501_04835 [Nocardia otitidiscaviarum]|uniref:hypothetical protein n=1 Tax=Nocardia otitidiscaviarum TaxID=1823 RepID=UPI0011DDF20B|nr:hypothetical protein [Nocardia otitidiscaviarum]MBF6132319.1 hypothetical protein [Nocardia otitidiscaviarum]MBF6483411.1 hypothetical protein [Nocardia otitidiscaviarum]
MFVICPHCSANLLRRERGDRRCSTCGRSFALEPKESPLGLHDLRLRRLVDRLRDERELRYTAAQLWYAASRTKLPDGLGLFRGVRLAVCATVVGFGLLVWLGGASGFAAIVVTAVLVVLAVLGMRRVRPWFAERAVIRMPVPYDSFRADVIGAWAHTYGAAPPGVVDENTIRPPAVDDPRYAVLCQDRSVLACLSANDVAGTWSMLVTERMDLLPADIPVFLLHDASVRGVTFAVDARAALGSRAVTVGLLPHTVAMSRSALRLREPWHGDVDLDRLRREGLPESGIEWLAEGWWAPIAAVPPAKLLSALGRAIERVDAAGDPDHDRARRIGFLSWPTG